MSTTCTKPAEKAPDHEAMMAYAIEHLGFPEGFCTPTFVRTALQAVHTAYVRSRRDRDAARLALLDAIQALVDGIEDNLRETLHDMTASHTEYVAENRGKPLTRTSEEYVEQLALDTAARRWLYGA